MTCVAHSNADFLGSHDINGSTRLRRKLWWLRNVFLHILEPYDTLWVRPYLSRTMVVLILCVFAHFLFARPKVSVTSSFMSNETKSFVIHPFLSAYRVSFSYRRDLRVYRCVGLQVWSWVHWRREFSGAHAFLSDHTSYYYYFYFYFIIV